MSSISRREFVGIATAGVAAAAARAGDSPASSAPALRAKPGDNPIIERNTVITLSVTAAGTYQDPYNDVDVDFIVTAPNGEQQVVPGYYDSGQTWSCNFCGTDVGTNVIKTRCSVASDSGLHGRPFTVDVKAYQGTNPLYGSGRLRSAADKHHLEHMDGTPFLWIGDTWWMGLCARLNDDNFAALLRDRAAKGFSLVQIIAGPYPDMDAWDPRGAGPSGFPFEQDFARVNASYFADATRRIQAIVDAGLVPCIVGMWGYYLPQIGLDKVKRFWRNLVARFAAYPVVWCICGEATMPYYLSEKKEEDAAAQKAGWTEVMRYVREIDGYHNPITIHPTQYGHEQVDDPSLMDVDMLQTGHSDIETIPNVIKSVRTALAHEPKLPIVNGEVNYEGIMGRCWQNIIRLSFYHSMLNGVSGFTYGANGIWQVNEQGKPYGPSPHGRAWGNTPWDEAMNLPGSRQVGLGGKFFARFAWWELQRQPDWYDESKKENDAYGVVVAGIPRKLRIAYAPMCWNPPTIKAIETDLQYSAYYFDPITGNEIALGPIKPDENGNWTPPFPPEVHDWVIFLQA
ncbi:MAG: DUF4038 domain-containing protein [Candidatus Hydrogenedentes bacterium]|nr:DUF4038 domain-containing protein [Candidatus Hydrogenedentota bacterium]